MAKPYAFVNEIQSTLNAQFVHGTDVALTLVSAAGFPTGGGYIRIGAYDADHWVLYEYTGVSTNDLTGLTPCTLGEVESEAAYTFPVGTVVEIANAAEIVKDVRDEALHVTTKTGTATLTPAEAGIILVSAAAPYTVTFPTAVGNKGLRYHFIKTDANYNLITNACYGAETIDCPNDAGVPQTTYERLNTYRAEATFESDGSNWQCMNEVLGQAPSCWAWLSDDQINIESGAWPPPRVELDSVEYDIGNNFTHASWVSGTATSTSAGHLVDTAGAFVSGMVGAIVYNTTDSTQTYITAVNSATDVTLRDDIFVNGEAYNINYARYIFPIAGQYQINFGVNWFDVVADKRYGAFIQKNGATDMQNYVHSSITEEIIQTVAYFTVMAQDDYIHLAVYDNDGVSTSDVNGGGRGFTFLQARLISKN